MSDSNILQETISKTEKKLRTLPSDGVRGVTPPFPIDTTLINVTNIGKKMTQDLIDSYQNYFEIVSKELLVDMKIVEGKIQNFIEDVSDKRTDIEKHILYSINRIACDNGGQADAFRVLRLSNFLPSIALRDLLVIACDHGKLALFNPFLMLKSRDAIIKDILLWLQLCVLEDKLHRLLGWCQPLDIDSSAKEFLVQELLVYRNWDVHDYVEWLVFEVESQLQIRPKQFEIAKSLIDNPGAIVHFNMGEGKTRCIIPMLVLHWTARRDGVVRLHFLPQLLNEAFSYLHEYICASVLSRKLFLLPFNRDVDLTKDRVRSMLNTVNYCRRVKGCIIVAPEHRLSLSLKWHELNFKNGNESICSTLSSLEEVKYYDMLDESDEILRHKYQLTYAVGNHQSLPSGSSRWNACLAVLLVVHQNERVKEILNQPNVSIKEVNAFEMPGSRFTKFRLIPGDALSASRIMLLDAISRAILDHPTYEMMWMTNYKDKIIPTSSLIQFMIDPNTLDDNIEKLCKDSRHYDDLLALRGLLACEILIHTLIKRHGVDYGINRRSGKKRLAVPYRAADVPSQRSEYSHPDVGIMLSQLAYFYDGLSRKEFEAALKCLFSKGEIAQIEIYKDWLNMSCKLSIPEHVVVDIDSVRKLDMSNIPQMDILYSAFQFNMSTISYWLHNCVFPIETMQYPHKLLATNWNLANNISGTNNGFLVLMIPNCCCLSRCTNMMLKSRTDKRF